MAKPKQTTNAGPRWELMEQRLFEVAAQLFTERGFSGTSLQDIADAMGISRPALYYYVDSKEALLDRLAEEIPLRDAARLRAIRTRAELDPRQKLRLIVETHVRSVAAAPERLRMLDRNEQHLSPETAAAYSKARRSVLREITAVIQEGVDAGQFRPLDARTAALGLLGMSNWVAWWFEPAPDHPPEPIVQEIAEMALNAVAAAGDGAATPRDVLRRALDDLTRLERLLP